MGKTPVETPCVSREHEKRHIRDDIGRCGEKDGPWPSWSDPAMPQPDVAAVERRADAVPATTVRPHQAKRADQGRHPGPGCRSIPTYRKLAGLPSVIGIARAMISANAIPKAD